MKKVLFFCLVFAGMSACDDPSVQRSSTAYLFIDAEALMNSQAQLLDSLHPNVAKTILVNGQAEDLVSEEKINWAKELAVFKELNISKPGLQSSYAISSPAPHIRLYSLKPGEHANVQWLKITFATDTTQLQSMEGLVKQTNYLYQSEKLLKTTFLSDSKSNPQLTDYQIDSRKKILFGDEEILQIHGRIPNTVTAETL